jgi:lysine 2,3-aminomutase
MQALIDPNDHDDPIAKQFVPHAGELHVAPAEMADPIGDAAHSPCEGLVHRYRDRVLLKMVSVCPVYCRFCFRREMVGQGEAGLSPEALNRALAYVAGRPEIFEIIVTGGDPFMLSPRRIADLMAQVAAIPHIKVVRWHTRVPMVDSARVTPDLVAALKRDGIATWIAIHANHPREFTKEACAALARLADAGLALVSQSVLLKGVNDDAGTLAALMRAFLANRVKPYYLHHPDLAKGTAHFRLGLAEGEALVAQLRGTLSGLAQPTYVLDVPGHPGKIPLTRSHFKTETDPPQVRTRTGEWVDYPG